MDSTSTTSSSGLSLSLVIILFLLFVWLVAFIIWKIVLIAWNILWSFLGLFYSPISDEELAFTREYPMRPVIPEKRTVTYEVERKGIFEESAMPIFPKMASATSSMYIPEATIFQCSECERQFQSAGALNDHENSVAHDERVFGCPVAGCNQKFKTRSGIAHHCESEQAHPTISRHDVTRTIQNMDVNHVISSNYQIEGPAARRRTQPLVPIASESSFNGSFYECLFKSCNKRFHTLNALNTHLSSPAHDDDEFICRRCDREFKVISSLAQHVEARVCKSSNEVNNLVNGLNGRLQPRQLGY